MRPRIKVRPQMADEPLRSAPVVSRVAIPSPEEAGIGAPASPPPATRAAPSARRKVDWNATHTQLAGLSATGFGLVAVAGGQQFFIVLPGGKRVVGEGRDGAEAVASALQKARLAR